MAPHEAYRLAVGFAGLTAGFGIIRFISLHEVDAWNASAPSAREAVDLVAAAGVSALAIARLCHLRADALQARVLTRTKRTGSPKFGDSLSVGVKNTSH